MPVITTHFIKAQDNGGGDDDDNCDCYIKTVHRLVQHTE
jgi:hypothetical protein